MTRRLLPLTVLALLLGGCLPAAPDSLWRHRDQFVRLETHTGPASSHPAAIEAARLSRALGALQVRPAEPLFVKNELDVLADTIARGLAAATPQQDVTFAVVGMHRGAFTLERRLTSGRLFYRNGTLHLLFGALHAPYDGDEDRRLHPFPTGSRTEPETGLREIAATDGVSFADGRGDWLHLDLDSLGGEIVVERHAEEDASEGEVETLPAEVQKLRERLRLLRCLHGEGLISDEEYARKKQEILDSL